MPLYDYLCEQCHRTHEVLITGSKPYSTKCPDCNANMTKVPVQLTGRIHYDRTIGPKS